MKCSQKKSPNQGKVTALQNLNQTNKTTKVVPFSAQRLFQQTLTCIMPCCNASSSSWEIQCQTKAITQVLHHLNYVTLTSHNYFLSNENQQ